MPRLGRHPLKERSIKEKVLTPNKITITTIVYIPTESGYWEHSFMNLKLFFQSLVSNTTGEYDLMVFDNGSCKKIIDYLNDLKLNGIINFLILSKMNHRKLGALDFLLHSARGDYIAYADSDVYFLPNWIENTMRLFEAFPKAGKITSLPLAGGDTTAISEKTYNEVTHNKKISVNKGIIIPDDYIKAHCLSLGKTLNDFKNTNPGRVDIQITSKDNISAYISTADFQFILKRECLNDVLPLTVYDDEDYYDPIYSPVLEKRLYMSGWWQLSTCDYNIHHLGNKTPNLIDELSWVKNLEVTTPNKIPNYNNKKGIRNRIIRKVLKVLNLWIYKILYD